MNPDEKVVYARPRRITLNGGFGLVIITVARTAGAAQEGYSAAGGSGPRSGKRHLLSDGRFARPMV